MTAILTELRMLLSEMLLRWAFYAVPKGHPAKGVMAKHLYAYATEVQCSLLPVSR